MKPIHLLADGDDNVVPPRALRAAAESAAPQDAEKPDPYATPFHRSLDAALILVTVLVFAFLWLSSDRGQYTGDPESSVPRVELNSTWAKPAGDAMIVANTRPLERPQP